MSESAKLLAAVAQCGKVMVMTYGGPWVAKSLGEDPRHVVAQRCQLTPGLHVWESAGDGIGSSDSIGAWRPLEAGEWDRLANGLPVWEEK